jgi:hypothetical protein
MKEAILPSLPLFLVLVLFLPLIVPFAFMLFLGRVVWACLRLLLPLLAASLLLYIEDLLIWPLLRL